MTAAGLALPKRRPVRVDGVTIAHRDIAVEAQNHPAATPTRAFVAAAKALVIRELLLREARRRDLRAEPRHDEEGRRETEEEALIRGLVETIEGGVPAIDEAACRGFHEAEGERFRSGDLFEASHILIAVEPGDPAAETARGAAERLIELLIREPKRFAAAARASSACSSRENGGSLGQFGRGAVLPEFEAAIDRLRPGEILGEPVRTRHGFHVVRLDRRIDGRRLPFEAVRARIAAHLERRRRREAVTAFLAGLVRAATIEGVTFDGDEPETRAP